MQFFRERPLGLVLAGLVTVWMTATGAMPVADTGNPGAVSSESLANAPDDHGPTPEQRLLEAGIEPTVDAMGAALAASDTSVELRYWTLLALGRTGEPSVQPLLVDALEATEADIRYAAVLALGSLGQGAEALEPALDDPTAGVRAAAVQSLGQMRTGEALTLLIAKLFDSAESESEIRMQAAFRIARFEDRRAHRALRGTLNDGSATVRAAAALGLAERQRRVAVPALVTAALDPLTEEWLRVDVIEALEAISGEAFQYVKPYSAPSTDSERAAALASLEAWWWSHQDEYR